MSKGTHRILVVDDEPRNIGLIAAILEGVRVDGDAIHVARATSGGEAIDMFSACIDSAPFDLVLLDVMMPELDGFSVLRAMRAVTPAAGRIPVVLVTALGSREDRIRGLETGADDFLTKPLDPAELRCRVRTFLSLRRTQRDLEAHARELEAAQLARAELTSMIVHDLKNPLAGVSGSLSWLARTMKPRTSGPAVDPAMLLEAIDDAQEGTRRVLALIRAMAEVERAENGQLTIRSATCSLPGFLENLARVQRKAAESRSVTLHVDTADLEVELDREVIGRVLENLVENAVRHADEGGRVAIEARTRGGWLELSVANTGPAIAEAARVRLFEKYARGDRRHDAHLGLGLYFCRVASRCHGGDISVESTEAWPTRFVVRIPLRIKRSATAAPFSHA